MAMDNELKMLIRQRAKNTKKKGVDRRCKPKIFLWHKRKKLVITEKELEFAYLGAALKHKDFQFSYLQDELIKLIKRNGTPSRN